MLSKKTIILILVNKLSSLEPRQNLVEVGVDDRFAYLDNLITYLRCELPRIMTFYVDKTFIVWHSEYSIAYFFRWNSNVHQLSEFYWQADCKKTNQYPQKLCYRLSAHRRRDYFQFSHRKFSRYLGWNKKDFRASAFFR